MLTLFAPEDTDVQVVKSALAGHAPSEAQLGLKSRHLPPATGQPCCTRQWFCRVGTGAWAVSLPSRPQHADFVRPQQPAPAPPPPPGRLSFVWPLQGLRGSRSLSCGAHPGSHVQP